MFNENEIKFDQIKLGDKLGEGGFGIVYKATYLETDVAVKKLKSETFTAQTKEEFIKETDMMKQLKHPHIVQLYGISTNPFFMVMEYLPKGSLFHLIHSKEDITWNQRYQIGIDIGKGIYYLHEYKIIHRDLKSLNVLLDNQYHAKLCDFGLAKLKSESSTTTKKSSSVPGTTRWKAPELFKRGNSATTASDIYAYGIILWEMSARQIPYQEESDDMTVINWIITGEQEKIPDGPKPYTEAIQKSWSLTPSQRPSALDMITLLKEGHQVQAEKTLPQVSTGKSSKETSADTQKNPQTGPNYLSILGSIEQSGPNYISVLTSGPNYISVKNSTKAEIPIEVSKDETEKNQTITPEPTNFLEETTKLLNAHPWTESQTKYFSETLNVLSFNDVNLQAQLLNEIKLLPFKETQKQKTHYPFFKQNAQLHFKNYKSTQNIQTLTDHTLGVTALLQLSLDTFASGSADKTITIWRYNRSTQQYTASQTLKNHTSGIRALLQLSPDTFASGSDDKIIIIWHYNPSIQQYTASQILEGHVNWVSTLLQLSADTFASGSADKTIIIWRYNPSTQQYTASQTLKNHTSDVATLLKLSADTFASGSWDKTIIIWRYNPNTQQYTALQTLKGHTYGVLTLLQLSLDTFASGSYQTIIIWRYNSSTQQYTALQTFKSHTDYVQTLLQLSADTFTSGSRDNTIIIWRYNSNTQQCIALQTLKSHTHWIRPLIQLSADTFASGSEDKTIKIWQTTLKPTLEELEEKAPECKMM